MAGHAHARGLDPRRWAIEKPSTVERFFTTSGKHVLYFAGYGELGYQDLHLVRRVTVEVLDRLPAGDVLVHGSTLLREGGQDGIAEVYGVAKELGFTTTGIYPSVAMRSHLTHRVSPHCEHVFFVEDGTWGGVLDGSDAPSPTLRLHLRVSHEMVVVGGGKHTADELRAFAAYGKPIRYVPARMNEAATQSWCREVGMASLDPYGAARLAWQEVGARACVEQGSGGRSQPAGAAR